MTEKVMETAQRASCVNGPARLDSVSRNRMSAREVRVSSYMATSVSSGTVLTRERTPAGTRPIDKRMQVLKHALGQPRRSQHVDMCEVIADRGPAADARRRRADAVPHIRVSPAHFISEVMRLTSGYCSSSSHGMDGFAKRTTSSRKSPNP